VIWNKTMHMKKLWSTN